MCPNRGRRSLRHRGGASSRACRSRTTCRSRASSFLAARMMIFGRTRISSVCSSRTKLRLVKSRLRPGIFESTGTPISISDSPTIFWPPISSVPPSGTETLVINVVVRDRGNWMMLPPVEQRGHVTRGSRRKPAARPTAA